MIAPMNCPSSSTLPACHSTPIRGILAVFCARAASGQITAAPPRSVTNSRRLPRASVRGSVSGGTGFVRFGSKADICTARAHVRFTPKSRHVQCTSACLLYPSKVVISENSQTLSARRKPAALHGAIPAVWLIFANVIAIDAELSRWMVSAPARQIGSTRHGIGDVVVATGAMVNRVLATSRNASFEAAELVRQPFAFRQRDPARIEHRQQIAE
jgi:hypothetical protein